nr:MAG TPA: hypothetical protein [Caudoviricetes sp.]
MSAFLSAFLGSFSTPKISHFLSPLRSPPCPLKNDPKNSSTVGV